MLKPIRVDTYKDWPPEKLNYLIITLSKIRDDKKYQWFDARKAIFDRAGFYVLRYNSEYLPDKLVYASAPNPQNQNRSFWITVPCPWSDTHDAGQAEWTSRGGGFHTEVTHWRHMEDKERDLFALSLKGDYEV